MTGRMTLEYYYSNAAYPFRVFMSRRTEEKKFATKPTGKLMFWGFCFGRVWAGRFDGKPIQYGFYLCFLEVTLYKCWIRFVELLPVEYNCQRLAQARPATGRAALEQPKRDSPKRSQHLDPITKPFQDNLNHIVGKMSLFSAFLLSMSEVRQKTE